MPEDRLRRTREAYNPICPRSDAEIRAENIQRVKDMVNRPKVLEGISYFRIVGDDDELRIERITS